MNVSFRSNESSDSLVETIQELLNTSDTINWAVAFASSSAFNIFREEFESFFRRGGRSRAVFDISQGLTDPDLLEELMTWPADSEVKILLPRDGNGFLHHKAYLFSNETTSNALVGSVNFSRKAFRTNYEGAIHVSGPTGDAFFTELKDWFDSALWFATSAISPDFDPDLLDEYRRLYERKQQNDRRRRVREARDFDDFFSAVAAKVTARETLSPQLAYFLGLISGSAHTLRRADIARRLIRIQYKKGLINQGNQDQGFICARIDGNLLGNIKLPQRETQRKFVETLRKEIATWLSKDAASNVVTIDDRSQAMTNIWINIEFGEDSHIFPIIEQYLDEFDWSSEAPAPAVPTDIIETDDPLVRVSFLRGYLDVRGRVSRADRTGTSGKLRVAAQVSTNAIPFAETLVDLLDDYTESAAIAEGTGRDRDHLIRFLPSERSYELFRSGWKRGLVRQFHRYNNEHY